VVTQQKAPAQSERCDTRRVTSKLERFKLLLCLDALHKLRLTLRDTEASQRAFAATLSCYWKLYSRKLISVFKIGESDQPASSGIHDIAFPARS
jgi:hypothetical protein